MTVFSNFFSADNVQGQQFKGQDISLSSGVTRYNWPIPGVAGPVISQIMNIIQSESGSIIELPPANQTSKYKSILFVNRSAFPVTITSSNADLLNKGTVVKTLLPLTEEDDRKKISAFFLYLEDEKTVPGKWFSLAFGASGVSIPTGEKSLEGQGLGFNGQALFRKTDTLVLNQSSFSITSDCSTKLLVNKFVAPDDSTSLSFSLPAVSDIGETSGFFVYLFNTSTTTLSLIPVGTDTINGSTGLIEIPIGISMCVCVDQSQPNNWLTFLSNSEIIVDESFYFPSQSISSDFTITEKINSKTLVCETPKNNHIALTLPDPATLPPNFTGDGFNFYVVNRGNGNVLLTSAQKINNFVGSTLDPNWMTFGPKSSFQVISDGSNWYTLMHGINSGRIIFASSNIVIVPSHFGSNILCTSNVTVQLDTNNALLWEGFRFTISAGASSVTVQTASTSKLNGNAGGHMSFNYVSPDKMMTTPFGTTTFVYDGNSGWWQI